jgi:hypothetical protein
MSIELQPLSFSVEQPAELTALLDLASKRITERPELLKHSRTAFFLEVEIDETYGHPAFVPEADVAKVAFRADGLIYDFSELPGSRRWSGGWAGGSIPAGMLRRFFAAWLEQTDPNRLQQIALF